MYILSFKRSKSKFFQKALNHVTYMGGSWDGETAKLMIQEKDLLTAYEDLVILFRYIQNWKSTRATFRNKFGAWHQRNQLPASRISLTRIPGNTSGTDVIRIMT